MTACDIVIRGGTIADGSGDPAYTGDIAIAADRIVYAGPCFDGRGAQEIDAAGLIVTPGFVDIHTHYDGQAIWSDTMSPSSSHGVTTAILGNCGVGFAPCRAEDHDRLIRVMEGVEDIPGVVMAEGLPWNWESFPDYLDALDARQRDIDIGAFLPHSPLRVYVMGERGARREAATADDLARMQAIAGEAIDAGALGFATSRLLIHRTLAGEQIPSYAADDSELKAIASALKARGKGVLQMVLDAPFASWDDELAHLLAVVKDSGRPATFTMGLPNQGGKVWEDALRIVAEANADGADIRPQILPRPVGMISGFELSTHPFCLCPSYVAISELPHEQKMERLRDPAMQARLLSETPQEGHPLAMLTRNWDWVFPFGDPPLYEPPLETSIGAQARTRGCAPEQLALDLLMNGGDGHGLLYNTLGNFYQGKLDPLHDLMLHPDTVLGLGDGGAHYGAICDASYPTFLLTYWVRDRDGPRLTIEEAVYQLAARPADTVKLHDRGRLAAGMKADVNVIDLAALRLHAPEILHDLPGGGRRLHQRATGYVATICGGQIIRSQDQDTGRRPGRLVRAGRLVRGEAAH